MKIFHLFMMFFLLSIASFSQSFEYTYDNAGNRIHREVVEMRSMNNNDTPASPINSQFGEMSVSIFPNPTAGLLGVEITHLPDGAVGSLQLFNIQGAELYNKQGVAVSNPVDMSSLPAGQYLLVLQVNDKKKEWCVVKR